MNGYAFDFTGHGVFTPDGRADTITDVETHNKALEQAEIERFKTNPPDRAFLYVKAPARDPHERPGNAHMRDVEYNWTVQTWLGTPLTQGNNVSMGKRVSVGFGMHTYRRAVDCRIFGTRYVGWYMESSGDYCRLRKAKRQ